MTDADKAAKSVLADLWSEMEDAEPLPPKEEADLGELCRDPLGQIEKEIEDLRSSVEEMDDLPPKEEADLGELCSAPSGQFEDCQLVDDDTKDLIGVLEEDDEVDVSDITILEDIEKEFEDFGGEL